ncbi:DUF1120 domain-containing protein [Salmonella enterica subsp. salamae]|nr:DUF1120 domain-containing protein [Salmonella enterica subsp. salamae]EDW4022799.1 DUF1120 domain-containing protein [Salmonella enterica subsp. salamae]
MNALFKKGVLVAALAMTASSVMAADSIDLKVTGKIVPPACTPAFGSGGGTVDFGNIPISILKATKDAALPEIRKVPVTITCEVETRFGVTFNDQRADSRPATEMDVGFVSSEFSSLPDYYFGLGVTSEQKQIGVYGLGIEENGTKNAAGEYRYTMMSIDGGATWTAAHAQSANIYQAVVNSPAVIYGFGKDSETDISPETLITFNVGVAAIIQDMNTLHVTDEITLDGLASINLVYL